MTEGRLFRLYAVAMAMLVAVTPVVVLAWRALGAPGVWEALSAPAAPAFAAGAVLVTWALALILGTMRGPAVLTPFAAHVRMDGPQPRWKVFARPLGAALAAAGGAGLLAAGALAVASFHAEALSVSVFALAVPAVSVALIAVVLWAAGQALPRGWVLGSAAVFLLAGAALLHTRPEPASQAGGQSILLLASAGTVLLALALLALLPLILAQLRAAHVVEESLRWSSARTFVWDLDVGTAAGLYRARPSRLRRVSAVQMPGARVRRAAVLASLRTWARWTLLLLRRDAVGASRTPGRLVAGACGLAAAGLVLGLSSMPETAWLAGAVTGALAYAALDPLTDGLRGLAASSTGSGPGLYGIGDTTLLSGHLALPLLLGAAAVLVGLVAALALGGGPASAAHALFSAAAAVSTAAAGTLLRVAAAVKPRLPVSLLSAVATPVGDVSVLMRLGWAFDTVLLAVFSGAVLSAAVSAAAWGGAGSAAALLLAGLAAPLLLTLRRWRRRRSLA